VGMLAVSSTMLTDDSFLQVLNPTLQNQICLQFCGPITDVAYRKCSYLVPKRK